MNDFSIHDFRFDELQQKSNFTGNYMGNQTTNQIKIKVTGLYRVFPR